MIIIIIFLILFLWTFVFIKLNKTKRIVLLISSISIFMIFVLAIFLCDRVIKPFAGYDEHYLEKYNEDNKSFYKNFKKEYYDFYDSFINYKDFISKYDTNFYYNNYKDSPFSLVELFLNERVNDGYSFIVHANNEYDNLKNSFLNNYELIKTPTYNENIKKTTYYDNIDVNNYVFNEFLYHPDEFIDEHSKKVYLNSKRDPSYWFSYNDEKKEIVFSVLGYDVSYNYYDSLDDIKVFLSNLYIG